MIWKRVKTEGGSISYRSPDGRWIIENRTYIKSKPNFVLVDTRQPADLPFGQKAKDGMAVDSFSSLEAAQRNGVREALDRYKRLAQAKIDEANWKSPVVRLEDELDLPKKSNKVAADALRETAGRLAGGMFPNRIDTRNPLTDDPPRERPTSEKNAHLPLNGLVKWEKSRKPVKFLGMYAGRDNYAVIENQFGKREAVPYSELSALPPWRSPRRSTPTRGSTVAAPSTRRTASPPGARCSSATGRTPSVA